MVERIYLDSLANRFAYSGSGVGSGVSVSVGWVIKGPLTRFFFAFCRVRLVFLAL